MPAIIVSGKVAERLRRLAASQQGAESSTSALVELRRQLDTPPRPANKVEHYAETGTVLTHSCLVGVAGWAAATAGREVGGAEGDLRLFDLEHLLCGAGIAVPVKPKAERSPALVEALRKIEMDQQQKEYEAMLPAQDARHGRPLLDTLRGATSSSSRNGAGTQRMPGQGMSADEKEWLEVRQQLSAIVNILVSVVAVATAVWWAGGTADPIWKTLVAIPLSILVAIAEAALYARHWSNLHKRRTSASKTLR